MESPTPAPSVTVIIATYNKSKALKCAIESVLWQTFADFELWVIGDCCTDDSEKVATGFGDPRVHWHNLPENTGFPSEPHNEGMRRAKGRYIAYLNHDDLWLPNHLEALLNCIEGSRADIVFSILEWADTWRGDYADIPDYPDAVSPPEASAILHTKQIVEDVGFWKPPTETYAFPRVEYFRAAQFLGKKFALAPALTVLKFGRTSGGYSSAGAQSEYMARIRNEPDFVHTELARLLVSAYQELDRPASLQRIRHQFLRSVRRACVKRKIDPARLIFWRKPGWQFRRWRKQHQLDS